MTAVIATLFMITAYITHKLNYLSRLHYDNQRDLAPAQLNIFTWHRPIIIQLNTFTLVYSQEGNFIGVPIVEV